MKRKIIFLVILAILLCPISLVFGQQLTPPAGVPTSFSALLGNIVKAVGTLVADLGVAMIIVAGILYLTSAGSPERIAVAKKALIYAIVGIAIGLAAQSIVEIVQGIMK